MNGHTIGKPLARVDGRAKVTGAACYAAEFNQPNQAYGVIVSSTIGRGRIEAFETAELLQMPGVLAVITHLNSLRLAYNPHKSVVEPIIGERLHVLQDEVVRFYGQPIAIVIADTLEQAQCAAAASRVRYIVETPTVDLKSPEVLEIVPEAATWPGARMHAEYSRGDADFQLESAKVRVDVNYGIARENHNPIEPHATIAAWERDRLTLWSKSQYVQNEAAEIAAIFGLPRENVLVICPFVGGGFGSGLRAWPHVALAAMAARQVGRPVKVVLTRRQMFFATGHRPRSIQRVALGATPGGQLATIIHEATTETSRYEQYIEGLTEASSYMYSCPNVRTRYRLAPLDIGTPTFMRGPGAASGNFALECAMDELAYSLGMDPVELRRRNEPAIDESKNRPFSSRSMRECYNVGVEQFGWSSRTSRPRSMHDGRLLIGWGMAAASYPVIHRPSSARVRLLADGSAEVEVATSDMGPGTYTSMTQVAAEFLGVPASQIKFNLGRSDFPAAPVHGGSDTMASVGSAVRAACLEVRHEATKRALADPRSPLFGASDVDVEWRQGILRRREAGSQGLSYGDIVAAGGPIAVSATAARDREADRQFSMHSFGAVFVEVAVDPDLCTIRVRRVLGAYGAGRIINPRLAESQCKGGMIGGIGMALMERTVLDGRDGRPVNAHMADYLLPVNLDVARLDVYLIEEVDPHVNPLGVKGLGELAAIGIAPATANAVFHATGKRIRELPIRGESLLDD